MIALPRLTGLTVRLRVDMLESRSPASSLMDLAALGLMAGDPAGLPVPAPPAVFVGLRPDLDRADGFDRPLTWAVPTDAGKMADTQSPTSFTSQPTDRRSGFLEIDVAPERQPTFTLPQVATQPPASADDVAPVSQARTVGAPAEPMAEVAAPALPAFLTLPAPKLPAKEDAPRSDPDVKPLPSSSSMTGPMPTGFVTNIQVQEVDFVTDTVVEADPGEIRYPSQDGKPEWRDANLDGYIFDQGTWLPSTEKWDPIKWSVPATVVRNTNPVVSAKFKVLATGSAPPGATHEVTIRGIWHGTGGDGIMMPPVTVPAVGDYVTYPATAATAPVPDYVDSVEWANIDWQFQVQGAMAWNPAGMSSTELFVTLAPPADGPVYHTTVMLSTRASAGSYAQNPGVVVAVTWAVFATKTLTTATPAFQPLTTPAQRKAGKPLFYYKQWDTPAGTTKELLETGDGRCGAWARLMVDTLRVHGIGASMVTVKPIKTDELFVIKSWEFGLPGSLVPAYPYGNVRKAVDPYVSNAGGFWHYDWEPTATDVTHLRGTANNPLPGRGQGNTIPRAIFPDHALVRIGTENKLYDPSYGTGPFDGASKDAALQQWEDSSVAGFMLRVTVPSVRVGFLNRNEDVIRGNKLGVLESFEE